MPDARRGTIVFSHANGFPAGTYRLLFDIWRAAGWRVLALDTFGHDPRFPVASNWGRLRDELLAFVDAGKVEGRLVYVGHSMGGYLSLLAASRRPAIVRAVVLLDAPIVTGWKARTVQALKLSGIIRRGGPGLVSAKRRESWASREAALEHFASKRAFASWDPRVLKDYIDHGLVLDRHAGGGAVRLAFDRDVETRVYNTLPHHLGPLLRRHPPGGPVHYLGGTRSQEGRRAGMAGTRALVGDRIRWIDGGHLFPMEKPEATADAVLASISA